MGTGMHRQICCVSTGTGFHGYDSMKNELTVSELLRYGIVFGSCSPLHVCCLQTRSLLLASSMGQLAISVASAERNKHSLGKGSLPVNANKTHFRPFPCALLRSVSYIVNKRLHFQQTLPVLFPRRLAECRVRPGRCDCGSGSCPCQITSAAFAQRAFSCYASEMFACAPVTSAHT